MLISLETKITGRKLDVDVQMPDDKLMVWGDPDSITQVWYNLVDNAAKFAPEGSTITVQISKKDGKAYTTVQNLGATTPRTSCHCCLTASTRRTTPAPWTGRAWAWACISSRPF